MLRESFKTCLATSATHQFQEMMIEAAPWHCDPQGIWHLPWVEDPAMRTDSRSMSTHLLLSTACGRQLMRMLSAAAVAKGQRGACSFSIVIQRPSQASRACTQQPSPWHLMSRHARKVAPTVQAVLQLCLQTYADLH